MTAGGGRATGESGSLYQGYYFSINELSPHVSLPMEKSFKMAASEFHLT